MSGQYPGNYNGGSMNPNQLNNSQQMINPIGSNLQPGGIMQMYPGSGGSGMLSQLPMSVHPGMGSSVGIMNPVGMQSIPHVQQQQQQQQQQQHMHLQHHIGSGVIGQSLPGIGPGAQMQQQHMPLGGISSQQLQQTASNLPFQSHSGGQPTQASNSMLAASQANPHKEINIVSLSRLGQETVQDITSRFQEIFAALKVIQPTANRENNTEKKVQEYFRTIRLLFKRVRIIYEKCNDGYPQGMDYTNVESLVPYVKETDHRPEPTQCEEYRKALLENQDLIDTVKLKNRQLREIIDRTRIIIWEINTMLSMRRS